jgi:transcriptional regulator GlxA family with amidase domain
MHTHLHQITNWPELAEEGRWNTGKLAKKCKVSLRTLERFFLKKFGKTPKRWILEQRQIRAAKRIEEGRWPKEVAADTGYNSHTQFSHEFKSYWGVAPGEYARRSSLRGQMS